MVGVSEMGSDGVSGRGGGGESEAPRSSMTARSNTTFPGSCTANGFRQYDSPATSTRPSPDTRTVSDNNTPPG